MAKSSRNAPGTYSDNGVRCTMNAPFDKAARSRTGSSSGIDGHNKAPFDKGQSMGNGGIPTRFFDTSLSAKSAAGTSSAGASPTIGITKRNVGERRFPNAK